VIKRCYASRISRRLFHHLDSRVLVYSDSSLLVFTTRLTEPIQCFESPVTCVRGASENVRTEHFYVDSIIISFYCENTPASVARKESWGYVTLFANGASKEFGGCKIVQYIHSPYLMSSGTSIKFFSDTTTVIQSKLVSCAVHFTFRCASGPRSTARWRTTASLKRSSSSPSKSAYSTKQSSLPPVPEKRPNVRSDCAFLFLFVCSFLSCFIAGALRYRSSPLCGYSGFCLRSLLCALGGCGVCDASFSTGFARIRAL